MSRTIIPGASQLTFESKLDQRFSVQDTGMVADCLQGVRGSINSGSNTFNILSPDPSVSQKYAGKPIAIFGAGPAVYLDQSRPGGPQLCAGNILISTIVSISANGRTLTLANSAVKSVTESQWACGTDNTPKFNNCIKALRSTNGGVLNWDSPGSYFFASVGFRNWFGAQYVDTVDFSNCHIIQGEHTKIVLGYPMGFLSINDAVYNKFNLSDSSHPTITNLTAPVAAGKLLLQGNPSQMIDGSGSPIYHRNDYILAFTGYLLPSWIGFDVHDAQILQTVFTDTASGLVILAEPTLKPFVAENYPANAGWTGPAGSAPFGFINITKLLIHDFRYDGLYIDSFFFGIGILYGGQCHGFFINGYRGNIRESPVALNYIHTRKVQDVRVFIDNLASTCLPYAYADTVAVGTSHSELSKAEINSSGVTYLHIHEGAANVRVDQLRLGCFSGTQQQNAHTETGGVGFNSTSLVVGSGIIPTDVGKTFQIGTYTGAITDYVSPTNALVQPPSPANFSGASVNIGFFIQAVHIAARSYGLKITNSNFIGYDSMSVVLIDSSCVNGGYISNCEITGRDLSTYLWDVECFGKGWRLDFPTIDPSRIYQGNQNIGQFVNRWTDPFVGGLEASQGLLSPYGGFGQHGSLIAFSNDLTKGSWVPVGVTLTANSTNILDPIGSNTATKIVTGSSSTIGLDYDVVTPTLKLTTGTGNNANRSFILSFYIYSTIENQMEILLGSFIHGGMVDLTNSAIKRISTSPKWQRIDLVANFGPTAASGTEILVGLCQALRTPVVGLSSTFYVWGVTLQEVSGNKPIITQTNGLIKRYIVGSVNHTGKSFLGPITDDGVSEVQIAGQANFQGKILAANANVNGLDFSAFRNIAAGAHWNGTNFVADSTKATIVQALDSQFIVYQDNGLTVGSVFIPTLRLFIGGGTMNIYDKSEVYNKGEIDALLLGKVNIGSTTGSSLGPGAHTHSEL